MEQRLIDANALKKAFCNHCDGDEPCTEPCIDIGLIETAPTVDDTKEDNFTRQALSLTMADLGVAIRDIIKVSIMDENATEGQASIGIEFIERLCGCMATLGETYAKIKNGEVKTK